MSSCPHGLAERNFNTLQAYKMIKLRKGELRCAPFEHLSQKYEFLGCDGLHHVLAIRRVIEEGTLVTRGKPKDHFNISLGDAPLFPSDESSDNDDRFPKT